MSNLENLVSKILSDGEKRAAEILDTAREQADVMLAERDAQAQAETDKMLRKAEAEVARSYDRLVAERKLQLRDEVLSAKGEILDRVFTEALSRLNSMSKDDFMAYLRDALSAADTDGEALLLPVKYGITDIDAINTYLKSQGKKGNLVLSTDTSRTIEGGFLLSKDGIEQNNTFEALVDFHRYRLEASIRNELF